MARTNIEDHIKSGLLTAPSAAAVMPMSRTTIDKLGRRGIIARISTPGIRETRFSAMELLRYCVLHRLPINPRLREAAQNFAKLYDQADALKKLLPNSDGPHETASGFTLEKSEG